MKRFKCSKCGYTADASEAPMCPHCKEAMVEVQKSAADGDGIVAIKQAIADSMSAAQTVISEKINTGITAGFKPFDDRIKVIEGKLTKIENLPVHTRTGFPAIHTSEVYAGRKMSGQGEKLREQIKSCKHPLAALGDEGKFNEFCKHVLDLALAVVPSNILPAAAEAQQRVKAYQAEIRQKTDLSQGTDAVGGYLVEPEYLWDMVQLARERAFALDNCTIINMGADDMYVPAELTLGTMYWVSEAGQITTSNPTWAQVHLATKKLCGLTSYLSVELLQDAAFDLVSLLSEMFGYAINIELDNQVLNGTGSPVSGVLTAAAGYSVVLGTGSTSFSACVADNFRNMIRKLSVTDSVNGKFIYSKDIQYYIDTLKDTQGRYIYREPAGVIPGALWSRPVIEASNAPLEAASAVSTYFAAFANWQKFYIGRRMAPTALEADPYTKFDYAQIRYRLLSRWALAMARSTAFVRLGTAAA